MGGMTDDAALIEARAIEDSRRFLLNALDPGFAPRLAPALRAIRSALADEQWHSHTEVLAAALRAASDIKIKTVSQKLLELHKAGMIVKDGEYRQQRARPGVPRSVTDTRRYRISDWPVIHANA